MLHVSLLDTGKLMQIEYALSAVAKGKTSLGICATNGVVLATEKKLPTPLIDAEEFQKVSLVTDSIGTVYSGMGPDFRVLLRSARKRAQVYKRTYQDQVPVRHLTRETAKVMQEFTLHVPSAPFYKPHSGN